MFLLSTALLAACAAPGPGTDASTPAPEESLKLEKVVMLMRHGIRPPTKAAVVPPGYSTERWPDWPVDFGLLTPRGAAGVKLLGESDRAYFGARGLFASGCPAPGTVVLKASYKERTINTAQSWAAGFMPGCAADVTHPAGADDDAIFHGLDGGPVSFDGKRAFNAALAQAPEGGLAAETERHRGELTLLARVLNCALPTCPLVAEPSRLVAQPHDRPDLEGPLDVGSTASQTLLLEYLEGNPMQGRMTPRMIGFLNEVEREFFELFCSVDGVGVKKALRAMVRPVREIARTIQEQDVKTLSTFPGIGEATAERIVAKLRRKVGIYALIVNPDGSTSEPAPSNGEPARAAPDVVSDAYAALLAVGHSDAQARALIDHALAGRKKFKSVNDLIEAIYQREKP